MRRFERQREDGVCWRHLPTIRRKEDKVGFTPEEEEGGGFSPSPEEAGVRWQPALEGSDEVTSLERSRNLERERIKSQINLVGPNDNPRVECLSMDVDRMAAVACVLDALGAHGQEQVFTKKKLIVLMKESSLTFAYIMSSTARNTIFMQ